MRRRKTGAGSMATTSCPSSFKVSGSPTGSKSPPARHPRNPKPPPPEPSGHHQNSAIAPSTAQLVPTVAYAENSMGYRVLSVEQAARLPNNNGALGLDIA